MPSSWLATWLDWRFLTSVGAVVHDEGVRQERLPRRTGADVARELAGRLLLRYVTESQIGNFRHGAEGVNYTTPTPYDAEEAPKWLVLPGPHIARRHALILDPARIPVILGPQWVAMGRGIQYILPEGFPADSIVVPGAVTGRWEIEIS